MLPDPVDYLVMERRTGAFFGVRFQLQKCPLSLSKHVGYRYHQQDEKQPKNKDGHGLTMIDARDYIEQHARPAPSYLHSEDAGKRFASIRWLHYPPPAIDSLLATLPR